VKGLKFPPKISYGVFSHILELATEASFTCCPMLSRVGHADPMHIQPVCQGVLGNYICLNCGENQPCGVMHSSPKYATTGTDRGTKVVESPCRDSSTSLACNSVMRWCRQFGLIFCSML